MSNYENNNTSFYQFADKLLNKREFNSCNASLKKESILFFLELRGFLFPHFSDKVYYAPDEVVAKLRLLERNLITLLKINNVQDFDNKAHSFIAKIPSIHDMLWEDAEAIFKGD